MRFLLVAVLVMGLGAAGVLVAGGSDPVVVHPKPRKAKKHKVPRHRTVVV